MLAAVAGEGVEQEMQVEAAIGRHHEAVVKEKMAAGVQAEVEAIEEIGLLEVLILPMINVMSHHGSSIKVLTGLLLTFCLWHWAALACGTTLALTHLLPTRPLVIAILNLHLKHQIVCVYHPQLG